MKANEALTYYQRTCQRELAVLQGRREELSSELRGLPYLKDELQSVCGANYESWQPADTLPLPGQYLISVGWYMMRRRDMRSPRGVRHERLSRFMNEVLLPLSGVRLAAPKAAGLNSGAALDACSDAERYFARTLEQINKQSNAKQGYLSVYHNAAGLPLALRKHWQVSSALTLEPVTSSDLLVPAGTIGRISAPREVEPSGYQDTERCRLTTYQVGDFPFNPVRLSAYAYKTALQRSVFAIDKPNEDADYDQDRGRLVEAYSIPDFQAAAAKIMRACGVEPAAATRGLLAA